MSLGHQWLALAAGGKIQVEYGHRSHNQPVLDLTHLTGVLTSQNHGYAVDVKSLEDGWEPWFINLNDGSNEGIRHKTGPVGTISPRRRPVHAIHASCLMIFSELQANSIRPMAAIAKGFES